MLIKIRAFSLIELLVVMGIVVVLLGISVPTYYQHMIKARRLDGQTALLSLGNQAEKHRLGNPADNKLTDFHYKKISPEGYYELNILSPDTGWILTATAIKSQARDKACSILALNESGERGVLKNNQLAADKNCW